MTKRTSLILLWLNAFFLALNAFFLAFGVSPTVNFVASIVSLAGLMSSWMMYTNAKD